VKELELVFVRGQHRAQPRRG